LRFYSLHGLKLDSANRPEVEEGSAYAAAARHDYTAPRKWKIITGLDDVVITQVS
jgi:phosphatidylinositol N-acetylglucosaminyltransferase subunit Q